MGFDIHLHIPEDSQQGRVIQMVAAEQHITPQEAAERLLDEAVLAHGKSTPAQNLVGAFSSSEDVAILDEAMDVVRQHRQGYDKLRQFDL